MLPYPLLFLIYNEIHHTGLFGSSVGTAMGYMCILFRNDRVKADAYIGYVMAAMVLGKGSGGLLTLLFPGNLFLPLIPAASISIMAFFIACKFVFDPKYNDNIDDREGINNDYPDSFHVRTLINVMFGAIMDNIGSLGIVPLALSPVMFDTFLNFIEVRDLPVMSESQVSFDP